MAKMIYSRSKDFESLGISYGASQSANFLYIDLPDNFEFTNQRFGSSESYMDLLIRIINFHIKTLKRICKGQTLRDMNASDIAAGIDSFKSESLNTYQTFYRNDTELQNLEPWSDTSEPVKMRDGSLAFII